LQGDVAEIWAMQRAHPSLLSRAGPGRSFWRASGLVGAAVVAFGIAAATTPSAQEASPEKLQAHPVEAKRSPAAQDFGALFDAVVSQTAKSFWDKQRLVAIGWEKRAAKVRQSVVEAPNLEEAARRINALLAEIKSSHTGLLTPDDADYYILLAVFGGAGMPQEEFDDRFWGAGVAFAGIGIFSVGIDGRDFVDAVLEGSPAARAGLKVGDEIVSVDGAPYHPIRSFRGKAGTRAAVAIRRAQDGAIEVLRIPVMSIAPLHAFREATRASARVIERDGRRIGYVHVWASVGDESVRALSDALGQLGIGDWHGGPRDDKGEPVRPPPLDGLIVDMRGKIGGTGSNAGRYLDVLDPRGPLVDTRDKEARDRPRRPRARALRGHTVVLIDHHTRSTGELFVHAYKRERQGPLIGTRTAGAVSAASAYAMPGGNLLYLAVTGLEIDGEVLEGPGVAPDIEVARPVAYSGGADPVLEAGVQALLAKAKARGAVGPDGKAAGP
jgi:carboxyl-terminal processing protease